MSQRPDGPADFLDLLRVASRNGISCDVCDGAVAEIERLRFELTAMTCSWKIAEADVERLRSRNDFLAAQVVELGHEVTRLMAELDARGTTERKS
jgi:CRP-like cAMP-binding protein